MAVRTKSELLAQMASTYGTGTLTTAAEVREFLTDVFDSVAFLTDIPSGGVSLQTVLDAILVDGTQQGITLEKVTSVADQITIMLAAAAVGSHGRYAAIVDNTDRDTADFPASVFTAAAAVMETSDTIAAPAYSGSSTFVTLGFATPMRLTGIQEEGNTLAGNIRGSFLPAVGDTDVQITIPNQGLHYVYVGRINASVRAGENYVLTEETP